MEKGGSVESGAISLITASWHLYDALAKQRSNSADLGREISFRGVSRNIT